MPRQAYLGQMLEKGEGGGGVVVEIFPEGLALSRDRPKLYIQSLSHTCISLSCTRYGMFVRDNVGGGGT